MRLGKTSFAVLINGLAGLADSLAVLRWNLLLGQHHVDVVGEDALLEGDDVNESCALLFFPGPVSGLGLSNPQSG